MRYSWLALGALLVWQTAGWTQQPMAQTPPVTPAQTPPLAPAQPQAVPLDPAHNPLDAVLVNWEGAMKKVDTLQALQCSRVENLKTLMVTKVYVGNAKYVRPNLGMLEMYQKDRPDNFEKIIVSGTTLYQYQPLQKEIRAHQLPPSKTGMADDSFLSFLFGMKAAEAKARYDLKLLSEDQYYYYLGVAPHFDQDKADFDAARLVLNKDNLMPRQLWFKQPNGDTITWDFPKIESGVRLDPNEFSKPPVPQGWKLVTMPSREQAPIIRQRGQ
jgi:TIGR03009 family protein